MLRNAEVFQGIPADEYDQCVKFLRPRLAFVRANPGQPIFKQGDWADAFYMVRLGHIRVGIRQAAPGIPDLFAIKPEQVVETCVASALQAVGARAPA